VFDKIPGILVLGIDNVEERTSVVVVVEVEVRSR